MSNPYYTNTGYPQFRAPGKSEDMRAELGRIEDGLDRLPNPIMPNQPVFGNVSGTGMVMKDKESAKALLDLDKVDNTADGDKPISTATTAALATKADAAATTAALATKADAAATTAALATKADAVTVAAQLAERPHRNVIINGDFAVHHALTSQTISGYASDVCWLNEHNGSTKTHSLELFPPGQTDVPGNPKYFSRTVVNSIAGAGNYVRKSQRIEGVRTLSGYSGPISFWARSDSEKPIAIELKQSFGTGGSSSASIEGISAQTCQLTTDWELITANVNIPSISGKVLGSNNDDYLELIFWFDAGSNFSSRTSGLGQRSGTFDIADVQFDDLPYVTRFERIDSGLSSLICSRYYRFFDTLQLGSGFKYASGASSYLSAFTLCFPEMRTAPSVFYEGYTLENCSLLPLISTKSTVIARVNASSAGLYRVYGGNMFLNSYL